MSVYINERLKAFVGDKQNVTQLLTHLEHFANQLYGREVTLAELLAQPNTITEKLNARMRTQVQDEYAAYTAKLLKQAHIPGEATIPPTIETPADRDDERRPEQHEPDEAAASATTETDHPTETKDEHPAEVTPPETSEHNQDHSEDDSHSQSLTDSSPDEQDEPVQATTTVEVDGDQTLDQYFADYN